MLRLYVGVNNCCYQVLTSQPLCHWGMWGQCMSIDDCRCPSARLEQEGQALGTYKHLCVWQVSKPSSESVPTISWGPGAWWQYQEPLHNPVTSYEVLLILWQAAGKRSKKEMEHMLGDHYGGPHQWEVSLSIHFEHTAQLLGNKLLITAGSDRVEAS